MDIIVFRMMVNGVLDFCLMDSRNPHVRVITLNGDEVHLATMSFSDTLMMAISDTGAFGSFYHVEKAQRRHQNAEPVVSSRSIFGVDNQFFQVQRRLFQIFLFSLGCVSLFGVQHPRFPHNARLRYFKNRQN